MLYNLLQDEHTFGWVPLLRYGLTTGKIVATAKDFNAAIVSNNYPTDLHDPTSTDKDRKANRLNNDIRHSD